MIRVVLIDIDNTLLSFSGCVKQAMRDGFSRFGLKSYTEEMFPVFERVNNGLWRQIEQGTLTFEALLKIRWNHIFRELGIDFDGEVFEEYFRGKLFTSAIPEEGALDLLEYLRDKYTLCVASNGPYEQQMNRLRVGGMIDCFSHFFISSRIGVQKPSRLFFDRCFDALRKSGFPGLRPEEAIIIGDSLSSDIAGGYEYGLRTCLYRKGAAPAGTDIRADYVVANLSEIKDIL